MEVADKIKPGYKKTKLGWIPNDWKLMSIDEITDRITNRVDVVDDEEYREIGIRSHGKGIFHKSKVTGKSLGKKRVFWIELDCFVVNIVFAWEQAVSKTTENEIGMIASHRFPMYKPKKGILDLNYLLYFFKTPLGKHLLGLASPGGAGRNKTLGQKEFGKLLIPIPPFDEQLKIAQIIKTWDDGLMYLKEIIKSKEQYKIGVMQRLLPAHLKDKEISKAALGEIADIKTGKKDNQDKIENGKYPFFVRSANVKRIDSYSFDGEAILVPGEGKIGEIFHYVNGKFDYHQRVYKISNFKESFHGRFIYYYMQKHFIKEAIRNSVKATVDSLRLPTFQEMTIFFPEESKQIEIANALGALDKEILFFKNKLLKFQKQHKGLNQQLLTGKIRVK